MAKYDVYGIGNALIDVIIEVDEDFFIQNNIEKGVMTLISEERQKKILDSINLKTTKISAGGSAANTIIGISQLGGKTAYSGLTARDELGKIFLDDMARHQVGMDLQYEECPPGHSGKCLVMVSPDAERTMNTFLGMSAMLSEKQISKELIQASQYAYMEGYLIAKPEGLEALIRAKKIAEQSQVSTAFTLSDPNIVKFFYENVEKVIGDGVDLLFCNEQEALLYSRTDHLKEACQKLRQKAKRFVITLGAKGALVYDGYNFLDIDPCRVDKVVDTNGAGDSFAAGFLYGLTQGYSYAEAGKIASLISSKTVSQFGPRLEKIQAQRALADMHDVVRSR